MSQHKEAAKSFLKMAGGGKVQEAYDQYVAPSFIHHNQYFKGDRQSLLTAMQEASKSHPNKSIEIHHIYEDGNTVITHSLVIPYYAKTPNIAVSHFSIRGRSHRRALGFGPADLEGFAQRAWDVLTGMVAVECQATPLPRLVERLRTRPEERFSSEDPPHVVFTGIA